MIGQREMDADFVRDVIAHMNADHADAVLNIARFYGKDSTITSAMMVDLNTRSITLLVQNPTGGGRITLALPKPLTAQAKVRSVLIRMSRAARTGLAAHTQERT